MKLTLVRPPRQNTPHTIGELSVDNVPFSQTMEDQDRCIHQTDPIEFIKEVKIKHKTAIPYGTYQVVMSYSNKFKKFLPELLDVPGYVGIRIHAGNAPEDTSGCICVGIRSGVKVINSRITTNKLIALIKKRSKVEKVFIDILPSQ